MVEQQNDHLDNHSMTRTGTKPTKAIGQEAGAGHCPTIAPQREAQATSQWCWGEWAGPPCEGQLMRGLLDCEKMHSGLREPPLSA